MVISVVDVRSSRLSQTYPFTATALLVQLWDVPPSCRQQSERLPRLNHSSCPIFRCYYFLLIKWWIHKQFKAIFYMTEDLKRGETCLETSKKKRVVATYCCTAHFGHCRILATRDGGQRFQCGILTFLSPATSARWIQPACPWSPSIPGSSLNVNVGEGLWPEAYNHRDWLLWAWMSRHFLSWLTLLSRLTPNPPLLAFLQAW